MHHVIHTTNCPACKKKKRNITLFFFLENIYLSHYTLSLFTHTLSFFKRLCGKDNIKCFTKEQVIKSMLFICQKIGIGEQGCHFAMSEFEKESECSKYCLQRNTTGACNNTQDLAIFKKDYNTFHGTIQKCAVKKNELLPKLTFSQNLIYSFQYPILFFSGRMLWSSKLHCSVSPERNKPHCFLLHMLWKQRTVCC